MDITNSNIKREKNKHLRLEDRIYINTRLSQSIPIKQIAIELNCSRTTIYNELKRGTVHQVKNYKDVFIYYPDSG